MLSKADQEYWRKRKESVHCTYVWKYTHPRFSNHYLEVDAFRVNKELPHFELEEVNLFGAGKNTHKYTKSLDIYFSSILGNRELQSLDFQKFNTIVIPQEIKENIEKIIKQFDLLNFRDCIFYLIAKIQQVYSDEISYYQEKKNQKEVAGLFDECKNLIEIGEKHNNMGGLMLENIKFVFKNRGGAEKVNDKIISIRNRMLLAMIMDDIVPFNEKKFTEWKTNISGLPKRIYTPEYLKNRFKKNIVKALHNYFIKKIKLPRTKSWELIAHILPFSLIVIKRRKFPDPERDVDIIRQWLKR